MSSTEAVLILAAVVAVSGGGTVVVLRRAKQREPEPARIVREARARFGLPPADEYEGSDSLRLLEETDAHLNAHVLANRELLAHFHPYVARGLDRLRDAIRDEHTDHQGDQ